MKRVRTAGLLALLALTVTAIWGAASASAWTQQKVFEAGSYPAKVTGTQSGVGQLKVGSGGNAYECVTGLSGEVTSATKVATVEMSGYCESFGIKSSFKMNGCKVELVPGWNALGFGPSGCGPITISLAFNCSVTIPAQNGLYATYKPTTGGIEIALETNRLRYSGCGMTENESGRFVTTWILSGVSISSPFEESLFAAERYATEIVGSQDAAAPHAIGTEGGKVECGKVTVSGNLSEPVNPLSLAPAYSECVAFGFSNATVTMNGCTYAYWLNETGATYTMDVQCPAGKEIQISGGTCKVSIPAQTGLKAVDYANLDATANDRSKIEILSNVSGLTYDVTNDGFACPFPGTQNVGVRTNGTYTGDTLLEGRDAEARPVNIKIGV
jgi:hypothetical protein